MRLRRVELKYYLDASLKITFCFTGRWFFDTIFIVPGSSMAEQFAVNEKVAGSSPARGAIRLVIRKSHNSLMAFSRDRIML